MSLEFDDLICPDCHTPLLSNIEDGQGTVACPANHGPWPLENRVVRFVSGTMPHDGRWVNTYHEQRGRGLRGRLWRRNANWGIPYLLRPMIAGLRRYPLQIVDLGCGGGWEFLTEFGRVTGVDYGEKELPAAASVYHRVIRAQTENLPLADDSADVVVSVWLFEHLADRNFVSALREIRRVLRPGGHLIFLADLDSSKPILRWAKRFPAHYTRYHVDAVGHYGLRTLRFTKFLLQREGFVENQTIAINKSSLLQPVTMQWMFNNELGRRSKMLRLYLFGCRLALKVRLLESLVYLVLMEYHRLADRWLPDTYAFSAAFDWIVPKKCRVSFFDRRDKVTLNAPLDCRGRYKRRLLRASRLAKGGFSLGHFSSQEFRG